MGNFTKKGIIQKLIILLIFLTVFNFIYPYVPSFAEEETVESQNEEAPGGILLYPVIKLFTSLGEGTISVIQNNVLGMGKSTVYIDNGDSFWKTVGAVVGGIAVGVGAIVLIALTPVTLGASTILAVGLLAGVGGAILGGTIAGENVPDDFYLPMYAISPQEIFSDQIPALHINFINPKTYDNEIINEGEPNEININTAKALSQTISNWYVGLRNIVLVALMIVLLYIGIRIVISTASSEKAKYKEHIKDWIIAVILLVFMHYIMAFAITITEYVTKMLNGKNEIISYDFNDLPGFDSLDAETKALFGDSLKDGKLSYGTNLMGAARIKSQLEGRDEKGNEITTWDKVGYTIIYCVLVMYTVMFLVIYLKRIIYMAFLTIMAPLVALTYPIDKITDGKAQAFDMWLKEYIFNLLLQPFHLLLYTVLVGSAMDLVEVNMIYGIVAIGFLLQSEKLLRKFFGFEKSSTAGSIMGGAVGGAMAMSAIQKMGSLMSGGKPKKSEGASGSGSSGDSGNGRLRTADRERDTDSLLTEAFNGGQNNDGTPRMNSDSVNNTDGNQDPVRIMDNNSGDAEQAPRIDNNQEETGQNPELDENGNIRMNEENNGTEYDIANDPDKFELADRFRNSRFAQGVSGYRDNVKDKFNTNKENIGNAFNNSRLGRNTSELSNRIKNPKSALGRDMKKLAVKGYKPLSAAAAAGGNIAKRGAIKGLKAAPRMALKAAGAATMGAAGMMAGLASDDFTNVFKYGAAAAGIGVGIGTAAGHKLEGGAQGAEKVKDEYMKNRYTAKEYQANMNKKADDKFLKDNEAKKLYKEEFGKKEYQQYMKKAVEYRKYGVTDDKMIIKSMKLDNISDNDVASKERIGMAKVASSIQTDKDLQDYCKRLEDNGINATKIKEIRKTVRDMKL